jgi:hypothetical protein
MAHIQLIFLVLAFVLFLLAGLNVSYPRVSFGWLGLAFLTFAIYLRP